MCIRMMGRPNIIKASTITHRGFIPTVGISHDALYCGKLKVTVVYIMEGTQLL